ncbi:uncharacterized protein LOC114713721 [Neltuma alba]|uniref:uncharacterized protein LOC114713721 n=1 Tax=Neltuma alba TaxID=207710 RepID=UPI0010A59926|nr:uncharacterized protein LOC114713721 [Prosopis alba]
MEEVDGHDHMNGRFFFPNLRTIEINSCGKLESLFPASCCKKLVHLESVDVWGARELEYVFGKSCGDDKSRQQNQNCEIHLPALNRVILTEVPNMVSMCPENYYMKASSLEDVILGKCPQLPINSFIDVSVEGHEGQEQVSRKKVIGMRFCNLRHLALVYLDLETIYDLERLQIACPMNSSLKTLILGRLNKLRNICVGPKNLQLSFQNLFKLTIDGCDQLKFVLSVSISRSLPRLRHLQVSECGELERIIEDDDDEECCFPNLHRIFVNNCKRLKCLFSISTRGSFPQLSWLSISHAPVLEQVFGGKQGATRELHINAVFPKLFVIYLEDLPKLHTICLAIDFQTVICRLVEGCPKLSLTSTDNVDFINSYLQWFQESESKKSNMDDDDLLEQYLNRARKVAEKLIKRDRPAAQQNNASSNIKEMTEASVEDSLKPEEAAPFAAPSQIESPRNIEASIIGETSNKVAMAIPSKTTETSSPLIPSISTPKKPQIATSSTESKAESSQSDHLDIYITESAQDEIKVTQAETCMPKQLEDDDLMRLFQTMEEGAAHKDDNEVTKALADLEASLKMDLNEIASSEESRLCLQNALHTLSSHCSDDNLKATVHSLQQEIQTILSSFKQAYATIETATNLEQKEKVMIEQRSHRKEAAMTLLSEIHKTQNSMVETQTREAELKEQISKLQDELYYKEKEIKECEIKLSSLQEQKKKCVSDTIEFKKELEAVKKDRSCMVEDRIKAKHQLENVHSRWSSCQANLKKTSSQLGIHLKQKL